MNDDLVKRLRFKHNDTWPIKIGHGDLVNEDGPEAADRIAKLEAALRFYANDENYRQVWDDQFRTWVTYVLSDNGRIARKALEGKDD